MAKYQVSCLFLHHLYFHFPLFSIEPLFGHFSPLSSVKRGKQGAFALSELEPGRGPCALCQGWEGLGGHEDPSLSLPPVLGAQEHGGLGLGDLTLRSWRPLGVRVWETTPDMHRIHRHAGTASLMPTALLAQRSCFSASPSPPFTHSPRGCFVFCFLSIFSSCP